MQEGLVRLFKALPPSLSGNEQPIQKCSQFMQQAIAQASDVAQVFRDVYWTEGGSAEWKINCLYAVNDAVQSSMAKTKAATPLCDAFGPFMDKAVEHLLKANPSDVIKGKVQRMCKVWEDRRVFSPPVLAQLSAVIKQHLPADLPARPHKSHPPASTPQTNNNGERKATGAAAGPSTSGTPAVAAAAVGGTQGAAAGSPEEAAVIEFLRPLIDAYVRINSRSAQAAAARQDEARCLLEIDRIRSYNRAIDPSLSGRLSDLTLRAKQGLQEELTTRFRHYAILEGLMEEASRRIETVQADLVACDKRLEQQGVKAGVRQPHPPAYLPQGVAAPGVKAPHPPLQPPPPRPPVKPPPQQPQQLMRPPLPANAPPPQQKQQANGNWYVRGPMVQYVQEEDPNARYDPLEEGLEEDYYGAGPGDDMDYNEAEQEAAAYESGYVDEPSAKRARREAYDGEDVL